MHRPKKGSLASIMLDLLEERFPDGVPTGELAAHLYGKDSLENRVRVRSVARTLRQIGYAVYGFGGIFALCEGQAKKLGMAAVRSAKVADGTIRSLPQIIEAINRAGDRGLAFELRHAFKETLLEAVKQL
ncbi:MAG: hypothetical protein ACPLSY_03215 [Moorellaceae bacterium]